MLKRILPAILSISLLPMSVAYGGEPEDPATEPSTKIVSMTGTESFDDGVTATQEDVPSTGTGGVPVDGGLSLLLAAGMLYGGRRIMRESMKRTVPEAFFKRKR